mgnify:CR=1 FL=1
MKVKALVLIGALMLLMVGFQAVAQDDVIEIEYWQYFFEARQGAMDMLIEQFEAENAKYGKQTEKNVF